MTEPQNGRISLYFCPKQKRRTQKMRNGTSTLRNNRRRRTLSFLPSKSSPIEDIIATNNYPRAGGI
jgi:hypothetical protein